MYIFFLGVKNFIYIHGFEKIHPVIDIFTAAHV